LQDAAEWVAPIREAFGNPFCYNGATRGRPENAAKAAAQYTGPRSHDVVLQLAPSMLRLPDIDRELKEIRDQLITLSADHE
jgi:hypothetical protein